MPESSVQSTEHAAVVLAAGGSRRLGHPKQGLTREGEPLVRRAVRLAALTSPRRLLVVVGANADAVAPALAGLRAELLTNPQWPTGLASSLRCAAGALRQHDGPVLILACDQPALEAGHLQRLLDAAAQTASRCAASFYQQRLGIPAAISSGLLQRADLLAGDRGFGPLLNELAADTVARVSAPELAFDIDTPEDEQAAIARGLLDAPDPAA